MKEYKRKSHERPTVKDFDYAKFSVHMHAKRFSLGMGVRELGEIVGCSAATISRIERGNITPTVPDFLFICYWFDLSPMEYFLAGDESNKTELMFKVS